VLLKTENCALQLKTMDDVFWRVTHLLRGSMSNVALGAFFLLMLIEMLQHAKLRQQGA